MAGIPSWRQELTQNYTGAQKWGTGINPVHGSTDEGTGRVIAPGEAPYGLPSNSPMLATDYGYTSEDVAAMGDFAFMSEHPVWGQNAKRGQSDLPPWGHRKGPPSGTGLRARKRGFNPREIEAIQDPDEDVAQGWTNKTTGSVLDSVVSDPSQLYVQTSSVQRDETRVNVAATVRGTDADRSGIGSRIPGMKVKNYPVERLDDMSPWTQDLYWRAFVVRTAGTADPAMMDPNNMYVSQPMTREVPADVDQGASETAGGSYGYVDGDYYV
jgi:hypothetical protein